MSQRLFFSLAVVVVLGLLFYALIPPKPPISPQGAIVLGSNTTNYTPFTNQQQYRIVGFLPSWNLDKVTPTSLATITDLAYFALLLDQNGNIIKFDKPYEQNPGWANWQKFIIDPRFQNLRKTLTIQMLKEEDIINLLASPTARQNAIDQILDLTLSNNFSGINLDFEPSGQINPSTKDNFTLFVQELSNNISKRKATQLEISVDIYPNIIGKNRLWDLPRLSPLVDYIVVMGYDYHYRGSNTAGPIAPLRGKDKFFNDDLITNLRELSAFVPSSKIILGVPFYGYRWRTTTTEKYSPTIGRGITATLTQIDQHLSHENSTLHWDHDSLTPYLVLKDGSNISQIYFENALSLSLKLDLVRNSSYQGIAIWALGNENDNSPLWQTINTKLR